MAWRLGVFQNRGEVYAAQPFSALLDRIRVSLYTVYPTQHCWHTWSDWIGHAWRDVHPTSQFVYQFILLDLACILIRGSQTMYGKDSYF